MDVEGEQQRRILCCRCGVLAAPNPANMCLNCIQTEVTIVDAIATDGTVFFCKHCERYLQPPNYWTQCELESKELLTICLKRIKGLSRLHLVDASFVWTEPHSKRLKVKVTVQKEIFNGTRVQQSTVVEFVVCHQMCDYCQKVAAGQEVWRAVVQARQKVDHKRTFLYLEQLILKHHMHEDPIRVVERPDGIDFFYSHKGTAMRMVEFLGSVVPTRWKASEELVSIDVKSNVADIHNAFAVDIAPVSREDLVCLPPKFRAAMGGLGPLTVCVRIQTNIVLMDPSTLQTGQIPAYVFWKSPFESLASHKDLTEFYVLDIDVPRGSDGCTNGKYQLANVQVSRASEIGRGPVFCCRTHLGHILNVGDMAMGYCLASLNTNSAILDEYRRLELPDVILVRKSWQKLKTPRTRRWKLQEMAKVQEGRQDPNKKAEDKEAFLQELETDVELRQGIRLLRDPDVPVAAAGAGDDDEEDFPEVQDEELDDEEEGEGEEGEEGEGDAGEEDMME